MRHTLPLPERCLAAVLFTAIGLGAFGCGDSASVNPVVELASLSVDPGTLQPAFSGGTTQYNVELSNDVTSVTINAQAAVAGDSVTINGQATTSSVISLGDAGTTTPVSIVVSESGTNSRTYTVLFVRAGLTGNNSLQSVTVSSGTLDPPFDANIQDYTVDVANNVGSVNITPTLSDPAATMAVNGQATDSGQARSITLDPAGQSTLITTIVTAQNSSTKAYRITVSRGVSTNNNLRTLTISPGTLNFRSNVTGYTVNVGSNVTSVTVRPTLADTNATMTVNGQPTNSGQTQTIQLGTPNSTTPIIIIVTAQNGTQKAYTASVRRATLGENNNLSALTVSPGSLDSAFNANDLSYTVNVASTVTSITVTPRLQDTTATMTVNGQATNSGQARTITLRDAGLSTTITIVVTAPNGSQKPYTITVDRATPPPPSGNNNLQSLAVSPGPLAPTFTAGNTSYRVDVDSNVTSITVTPRLQDTTATMTVNGQATNSGQARTITLRDAGLSTTITIVVTAPNGSQKPYTITVDRATPPPPSGNNNLSALSVRAGTVAQALSPGFTSNTTAYTVNVATNVAEVAVSATKADPNAVISGDVPNSGQANITLTGAGTTTRVSINVAAPNGDLKPYTIDIERAEPSVSPPPAPTSAPDLIPQADSCPLLEPPDPLDPNQCAPGTSREDNITNVNTPRFTIPQTGTGVTPHLYVDGTKVKDGFDQGATTLTPPSPLSDGVHLITSTVSNVGGESGPSPSLSVRVDTGAPGAPLP